MKIKSWLDKDLVRLKVVFSYQLPNIITSEANNQPVDKTKAIKNINFVKSSPSLFIERNKKNPRTKYKQTKRVKKRINIIEISPLMHMNKYFYSKYRLGIASIKYIVNTTINNNIDSVIPLKA